MHSIMILGQETLGIVASFVLGHDLRWEKEGVWRLELDWLGYVGFGRGSLSL